MTVATGLSMCQRLIAWAVLLQTVELWQVRSAFADAGVWQWQLLAPEHRALPFPLRWLFAGLLPYRPFLALLGLRALAAGLCAAGFGGAPALAIMLLSQVAICVRFRGTFNGGSDAMTVLVLLALTLAQLSDRPLVRKAWLLYIAAQAVLSYVIAGLVKLKSVDWRSGAALVGFVSDSPYAPPALVRLLNGHALRLALSYAVIAFECLFPLALSGPRICLALLGLGVCFHLANSVVFGLNRFVFAWLATYPALYYCSQL